MIISLIVAASENNAIGKNGKLLWHLPSDLAFFKNTTWGMPVIMGRKTFESVGKPLPGRFNIVITSQSDWNAAGVWTAAGIEDAMKQAATTNCKELFIIGGGNIYKQVIDRADKIYMTRVHASLDGDIFFPSINDAEWNNISTVDFSTDKKHAYPFSIQTWIKRSSSNNITV